MRRHVIYFVTVLAVAWLGWTSPAADTFEAYGLHPGVCIINDRNIDSFQQAHRILEDRGARGMQGLPPAVIFGRFPDSLDEGDFPGLQVDIVRSISELPAGVLNRIEQSVVRTLFREREILQSWIPTEIPPLDDMVLEVPKEMLERTKYEGPRMGSPREMAERNMNQNSEFMIGSILINIILPESSGGSEDWTDDEIEEVMSNIALGISQYQQKAHWVDQNFLYNYYQRVPVSREPIEGDWSVDYLWMMDALGYIGYDHEWGYLWQAHILNNAMRAEYRTDWVFTAFVVDASNNECWQGPEGNYVAYSYLGGPLMLVPYPACRFGKGIHFAHVFIHEMSHSFWALDEYTSVNPNADWYCNAVSGYMAVPNKNSRLGGQGCIVPYVPCIMNNAMIEEPLPICEYTMGQVGLWDENYNSRPDIYEIPPTIEFMNIPGTNLDTIYDDEYVVALKTWNDAQQNLNPRWVDDPQRIDYAPWLEAGYYRIDNSWDEPLVCTDGEWNESRENVGYFLSGFNPGKSTLTFKVENCIGLTTEVQKDVYYIGIKYLYTSAQAHSDRIDLSWSTTPEIFGAVFHIVREDLQFGTGEEVIDTVTTPDEVGEDRRYYRYQDERVKPGHEYRYRVVAKFSLEIGDEILDFEFPTRDIFKTSLIPVGSSMVSYLMPNPTSSQTTFTVDVPKTFEDPTGHQGASPRHGMLGAPGLIEVQTELDIAVYNVKGQRISTIYSGDRFGGLETFTWKGLDRFGHTVSPGIYFIRVHAGGETEVKKVVIIR